MDYEAELKKHGTYRAAAKALGLAASTFQNRLLAERAASFAGSSGLAVSSNNVALNAEGDALRQWVGAKKAPGEVFAVPAGHVVKGESALLDPEGRIMARWVKTKEGVGGAWLIEALQAAFEQYDGAAAEIPAPAHSDADLLTIYPVPDLHFGMYAWGEETGADYDTEIATRVAKSGIATLVAQSMPSEHAVVLVLGDYFHQNDQKNATPGSGHRLDVDGRWAKVYHDGALLLLEIVKLVATKHRTVEVKVLPGNHDEDAAVTLTVAMSLFFSGNKRVTVNMKPGVTWYRRFGKVLIGAHHGHTMKPEMMAMAMAVDCREDWGVTDHHVYYSGHIHHGTAKAIMGVRVETFDSPAAPDSYNSAHGYRSTRTLTAITHHAEDGEIGRHRVNVGGRRIGQ